MYHYKRYSWVDGEYKGCECLNMTAQHLYLAHKRQGLIEFLKLLNSWNDSPTCNGENHSKAIHKYVYCDM